mgnify:CR=1 FL=1
MTEYEMAERQSGNYLRKRKVTLVDFSGTWLKCNERESQWSPNCKPSGRLPRGYWMCPDGYKKEVMNKIS